MARELEGFEDAYRAPVADDASEEGRSTGASGAGLYVVSIPKLVILDVLTLRVYSVYWFYKHWEVHRREGARISPLARAIFSVFFVHSLFRSIDASAREQGFTPAWNAGTQATAFVGLTIAGTLFGRSDSVAVALVSTALSLSSVLPIAAAQKIANLASGDESGRSNSGLTTESVLAGLLGLVLWAGIIWSFVVAARFTALSQP